MKKKPFFVMLAGVLILLSLFSGCNGTAENTGPADSGASGENSGSGLPFEIADNLTLEIDITSVKVPETASVIKARRLIFDEAGTVEVFGMKDGECVPVEERVDAVGYVCICERGELSQTLVMFYDEPFGAPDRKSNGNMYFTSSTVGGESNTAEMMSADAADYSPSVRREIMKYASAEDIGEFRYDESLEFMENLLRGLGVEEAVFPKLTVSCSLTEADLAEYRLSVGFDPETGEPIESLPQDELAALSDSFTFRWRQEFGGIPVNCANWFWRIAPNESAQVQTITGYRSANGAFGIRISQLVVPTEYGEAGKVAELETVVGKLNDQISEILSDAQYFLADAELCYAIFETDVKNELVLYPLWVLSLETVEKINAGFDANGQPIYEEHREMHNRNIYAYDGFTGELMNDIRLPGD